MAGLSRRKDAISKSQYLKGLQCPKALWLYRYRKEIQIHRSKETEQRLAMGHSVGELAKQYFLECGHAVEVRAPFWDIETSVQKTQSYLAEGEDIIFEATAITENQQAYSRIDILRRSSLGTIELIEVKAATKTKAYHIEDMAFQYYVFQSAGFSVSKCYMMLVNTSYIRHGDLELAKLFHFADISNAVQARQRKVWESSASLSRLLSKNKEPQIALGAQCHKPFVCDYLDYCKSFLQQQRGELFPTPVANNFPPAQRSPKQRYQIKAAPLQNWLQNLRYPLYFLDYECFQSIVPLFDQCRPYQVIPFQFSLHCQTKPGGPLQHYSFLHMEQNDPRPSFIAALLEYCGQGNSSIIVYNQSFEASVNNALIRDFPLQHKLLQAINARMEDLFQPFQKHWLYSPQQNGSASLKAVLPAFTQHSYANMAIDNGLDAMNAYLGFMLGSYKPDELAQLQRDLLQYCQLDTQALSLLLQAIQDELHQASTPVDSAAKSPTSNSPSTGQLPDILH